MCKTDLNMGQFSWLIIIYFVKRDSRYRAIKF